MKGFPRAIAAATERQALHALLTYLGGSYTNLEDVRLYKDA